VASLDWGRRTAALERRREGAVLSILGWQDNGYAGDDRANFDAGTPVALFQAIPRQPVPIYDLFVYDVSEDGQRFLIITPIKQGETQPMSVVLNWSAKLNK